MLSREIYPGTFVPIDEEAIWNELLFGITPTMPQTDEVVSIFPGSSSLCLVEDLSLRQSDETQEQGTR